MSLNDDLVTYLSVIGDNTYPLPVTDDRAIHIRELVQQAKAMLGAGPPPAPMPAPVTMWDSTTAADIPADAAIVAGYVDGAESQWAGDPTVPSGDWARFPNAKRITISAIGQNLADFWDRENGDLDAQQAAFEARSYPGTGVYVDLSNLAEAKAALQAAGIATPKIWTAHWNGVPHICTTACSPDVAGVDVVATQYANPDSSGGHYDLSLVTAEFLASF